MYVRLDHHSGEPIYQQLVEQIKYRIASGQIRPGDQLPSIRELAGELKINTRTVVRAYDELRHAGLVVLRQGQGAFVNTNRGSIPAKARRKALKEHARRLLSEANRLGSNSDEVIDAISEVAKEMEANHESGRDRNKAASVGTSVEAAWSMA